ncbi:MAG: hypothetical protein FWG27_08105 [Treponema sp.]|nr:hypothetical protein [Treponema sp.]
MEKIFENLQFFIPLALFIAFRVISAKNAEAKKKEKKSGGLGELIKKIQEAQNNPDYSKTLTEDTEVYIPSKVPKTQKSAARPAAKPPIHPSAGRTKIETAKKKPISPKPVDLFTNVMPSALEADRIKISPNMQEAGAEQGTQQNVLTGVSGLTPLQQAVVWAEILGHPRGEFGF